MASRCVVGPGNHRRTLHCSAVVAPENRLRALHCSIERLHRISGTAPASTPLQRRAASQLRKTIGECSIAAPSIFVAASGSHRRALHCRSDHNSVVAITVELAGDSTIDALTATPVLASSQQRRCCDSSSQQRRCGDSDEYIAGHCLLHTRPRNSVDDAKI